MAGGQKSVRTRMSEPKPVQMALARDLSAPSKGRNVVRSLLGRDVPRSFVSNALLATSELVTNALLHAHGALDISARYDRDAAFFESRYPIHRAMCRHPWTLCQASPVVVA